MCFGPLVPGSDNIASLKPGDKIRLMAGYGMPTATEVRELYVIEVGGFSALLHDGTCLSGCAGDGEGFQVIGYADPETIEVAPKARELQELARRQQYQFD